MVKLKTICRSEKEFSRETKQDLFKVYKNPNPQIHPLQKVLKKFNKENKI